MLDEIIAQPVTKDRTDLLAAMLQAHDGEYKFDQQDLRDQVVTLFVAGHKTSSLLLSWSLFEISQHPDVEKKLHKEIKKVFGGVRVENLL
jgi:cytochrome P450